MKRIILAAAVLASGYSVQSQSMSPDEIRAMVRDNDAKIAQLNSGKSYGISEDLYQKVLRHEILMTDAINITRAKNNINIATPGHDAGIMSPAGKQEFKRELGFGLEPLNAREMRQMGMGFPDKQARARERAAKRRAAK
jgi:hypothetical protein